MDGGDVRAALRSGIVVLTAERGDERVRCRAGVAAAAAGEQECSWLAGVGLPPVP